MKKKLLKMAGRCPFAADGRKKGKAQKKLSRLM
jgi:hypothetical protein